MGDEPWWVMSLGGWSALFSLGEQSALVGDEPWWVVSLGRR